MHLLVSKKHRVLHITLNRPEKRNALTVEMSLAITEAIEGAQQAEDVGCILIGASGPVFCAGMDLDEVAGANEPQLNATHDALFSTGAQSLKPIVVAVNGTALGGGLGLVAQGHVVLAAEGVVFGLPEIRIGLWPFMVYRAVSAALGARRTLELSLTGQHFSSAEACDWGLVHRVCPGSEVADRAKAIARQLAKSSPLALGCGMRYVRESAGRSWNESGELAAALRNQVMASADFKEGVQAFKMKREAHWPSMPEGFYEVHPSDH